MTYTREEAQEAATKLVELTIKTKEMNAEIKDLKAGLKEFAEVEQLMDTSWHAQNGYVEISTVTKYKLEDIPVEGQVPESVVPEEVAVKAFEYKAKLSKEGKKMFKENFVSISHRISRIRWSRSCSEWCICYGKITDTEFGG